MATYYTLLTKIGQARIANAVALNQMVNLTYMAVGDGNGNPTTPNENQTALVREKYRATINQLTVDADNPNYLVAELIVPTNVGGWSIYEVGVFDDQNQLIAVANFPATYKPELAEGSGRDLIVRIIIQVSNTSVVTLKVDPAVILASQAWVAANYVKKITMAGGTTGQVLAKNSNANEDFKWIDPTAAVNVIVDSQTEEQTLASGQTIINLAKLTTQATAIYVEGVRLYPVTHYTINSDTRLTLKTSYPNGSKVLAVQNDPTSTIAMASTTQKGFTQLSSATNSTSEDLAATPKAVKALNDAKAPINNPVFTGTQTGTTAPAGTVSTRLATTEFVKNAGLQVGNIFTFSATTTLTVGHLGASILLRGSGGYAVTLPQTRNLDSGLYGKLVTLLNVSSGDITVNSAATDNITAGNNSIGSITLKSGDRAIIYLASANYWHLLGGEASLKYAGSFAYSAAQPGYQNLPSGIILQWGVTSNATVNPQTVNLPIAFPNAGLVAIASDFSGSYSPTPSIAICSARFLSASQIQVASASQISTLAPDSVQWLAIGY